MWTNLITFYRFWWGQRGAGKKKNHFRFPGRLVSITAQAATREVAQSEAKIGSSCIWWVCDRCQSRAGLLKDGIGPRVWGLIAPFLKALDLELPYLLNNRDDHVQVLANEIEERYGNSKLMLRFFSNLSKSPLTLPCFAVVWTLPLITHLILHLTPACLDSIDCFDLQLFALHFTPTCPGLSDVQPCQDLSASTRLCYFIRLKSTFSWYRI